MTKEIEINEILLKLLSIKNDKEGMYTLSWKDAYGKSVGPVFKNLTGKALWDNWELLSDVASWVEEKDADDICYCIEPTRNPREIS